MERPAPDAVRAQLGRILASPQFARSERLATFLRYVVERAAQGKVEELKETVIGVEVFRRAPGYDPKADPIVRVQAARLREKLRDYYSADDRNGELVIEVPKGSYAPRWRLAVAEPTGLRRWRSLTVGIAAASLCALGLGGWLWWRVASSPLISSIAVLPLRALNGGAENESIADGLTTEIIHDLAGLPGVGVVSATSSFALKGQGKAMREIGRLLGVDAAMEGELKRDGSKVKVLARLVRTSDDRLLWSGAFEREVGELFALENEVASRIVETLRPKLREHGPRQQGMDPEAYQLYLRGLHARNRWTAAGWREALALFVQATEKDPRAARAWASLAVTYAARGRPMLPPREAYPKARAAALRALEIDATSADAYVALGYSQWFGDRNRAAAEEAFDRALQLRPSSQEALQHYCYYLIDRGQLEKGLEVARRAERLDPLSPETGRLLALMYFHSRRLDEAIAQCRKVLERSPEYTRAYHTLGRAYLAKGMCAEAMDAFRRMPNYNPEGGQEPIVVYAHARCGQTKEALRLLARWEQIVKAGHVDPGAMARIWTGLGDKQRAIDWLEKAHQERWYFHPLVAPEWDLLRGEPRFEALRKEMGVVFSGDGLARR